MKKFEAKFSIGDLLKNKVTDFEGIVMAIAFYHTGCTHYALQARELKEDGTELDYNWLDGSQLELMKAGAYSPGGLPNGGPAQNPPKM